ncbi:hypothetical protein SAMN06295937_10337 [Sphingopyxis flava]|uniref:Uncharacterized protein n=2 Tax=Sphingopyxis flava TaxID=1507287 RepID=A0A1T5FDG6_9SPHN|nr:hypothetical protein SAMN06295937_10337 [Sphingopyxis flava]
MMLRPCADGTRAGFARLAMLAAIAPGIGGDASAQVRQPELPLISSPWGEGMSPAEQAASAAKRPAFADANWNHEVCVVAYSFEGVPAEIARRRAALQHTHKENAAQAGERRRLAMLERQAAEHLPNIPKCKGQFYRPALASLCNFQAGDNRFCAQLSGPILPGVELVEDKAAFVRGLAWNKVGDLFSKDAAFAPVPWAASDDRGVDLSKQAESGIAYIAATNKAVKCGDGSPLRNNIGQWAFSVEMLRQPWSALDEAMAERSGELTAKTGMTAAIGRHAQIPRLHFQAFMFDILVESEAAKFGIEMRDGTHRELGVPASFAPIPDGAPAFYSSFASYRIHAALLPSADELRTMLDPDAAFLTASFAMRLEDGRIDGVTLRTPLTGIADAWKAMNAANLRAHRKIRKVEEAMERSLP